MSLFAELRKLAWLILRAWLALAALMFIPMALVVAFEPNAVVGLIVILGGAGALLALLVWLDMYILRRLERRGR